MSRFGEWKKKVVRSVNKVKTSVSNVGRALKQKLTRQGKDIQKAETKKDVDRIRNKVSREIQEDKKQVEDAIETLKQELGELEKELQGIEIPQKPVKKQGRPVARRRKPIAEDQTGDIELIINYEWWLIVTERGDSPYDVSDSGTLTVFTNDAQTRYYL